MDSSNYLPRPFRFRIGELLLGEWWPKLAILTPDRGQALDTESLRKCLPPSVPPEGDGLLFREVPADQFPIGVRRCGNYIEYVARHDVLYLIDIAGSFQNYLVENFSTKSRQNIVRAAKRLAALSAAAPCWSVYTAPQEMAEFLRSAAAISSESYQHKVLNVGLEDNVATLSAFQRTAELGDARGYLLRAGDEVIAFAWCRASGAKLVYDTIGYSTAHAARSPGTVLLYYLLADVFQLGRYNCLDFGPGEAAYKAMFSTRRSTLVDAVFFRRSLPNWVRVHLHFRMLQASIGLSHFLDRLGLKSWLKALLRRWHGVR